MKITKRLLSMLVAVVMVLSMIPAAYASEETVLVGTTEEWNAQIDALQSATAATTVSIKLTADIVATKELVIPFGINHNVTVDMDGHKLTSTDAIRAFNLHEGTLTIKNGTIEMPGINQPTAGADTTAQDTLDGEFSGYGGLGIVYKADLNLTDVTIKKVTTDNAVGSGGVLYVRSLSTVTLVRSHIVVEQDDTYDAGNAGAIAMTNYSGTPTVYLKDNSSVSGGYALNYGGNFMMSGSARVYIDATSKVFGGKINKGGSHGGGNFYCGNKNTRIYLNGGEIYGGVTESGYGGNLRINAGQLHMKGGKIYGGAAKSVSGSNKINTYGGNIALGSADAHAYLTGGEIYGGRAQSYTGYSTSGGNIYISSGSLTIDGGAKIYDGEASGTVGVTGGNIYNTLGTITLNDGEISGGSIVSTTTSKVCYGGNVYSIGGTLIMNGGKISDGSIVSKYSANGGNLYMTNNGTTYSKVIMNGGEITGGYLEGSKEIYGAAVALYKGSFILNDGYIGKGTVKKLTTTTSGGSTCIQLYSATVINADGDLDAFHMYGGTVEALSLIKAESVVLHEGKTAADLSKYVGACSTVTTEKVDGYYVITHQNTDGTENDVAATCTQAGKINVTCTDCTETVGGTTYGGTYAYETAALGHTEETVAGKAPTCTDTGLTDGAKCTVCGETTVAQEEIAANGHTEEIISGKAPTCNDTGLTEGKVCTVCGETTVAQEEIAANGHTEEIIPGKAPTCNDTGLTEGKVCTVCGETITAQEEIEAAGHTEEIIPGKAPTCTETGLTEGKKCSVCGEILTAQETVASTGHAWDQGVIDPAPTCNNAGTKTYTCATCGETKTEVVDATGHTAVIDEAKAPTCTNTGLTEGSHCDVCGEIIVAQEIVDALGHNEEVVPGKAPTCTETGLTEGTKCTVCGETVIAQEEIAALGHNEEVVPGKAPTCTETGLTDGAKCTVCGETTAPQEEIAALGHNEEVVPGKAPTCTETGLTDGAKCTVCGETTVAQEEIAALGHSEEIIPGKASTCTETGLTEGKKCSVCGEVTVAQEEIAALGHSYSSVYTEPTYEADGYTTYTCGTCGDTYTEIDEGTKLTAAAKIGDTLYKTLAAAVEAAQAGETVTLLDDVALTEQLTVSKALTLNLNGFDITGNVAGAYGMIYVGVKGNLTVVSTPAVATFSVEGSEITNEGGYAIGNYGTLSVDNVALTGTDAALYNFYYNGTTYGKATIGENASVSSVWNCGELTVNGAADYIDNSGALTVNGTVNELYAQDGSDAADVPGAGTVTVADTSMVTVPEGYKLVETETAGTYEVVEITYAAQIGETLYQTLKEAVAAVQDGETIQLVAGAVISEGTIKLPATLKNVTVKGAEGAVLKDMTVMAYDGSSFSYEGLTFDGITFDNSRISITGWRNGGAVAKDITVTNCTFKNLNDTTNSAPVHFNMAETEPVENLTFTNNVIDGATGGSKSGVYAQVTGKTVFTGNTINNVSFRPYVVQVTTDDGIADEFIVTGNTFSGSAAGRAQALANNNEGTDTVKLVVSGNIFKDITNAQQICYWNFNAETTTADLSGNYYDIDILANPNKIYFNSAAKNAEDLIEMGIYPYYADEAMTQEVTAPAIMVTYADGTVEYFDDMRAAVPHSSNVPKLEGATVTLLRDMSGLGMRLMENGMVFDLNGYTYTLTGGTGSKGTETSAFQIRPEVTETATIKNGTIKIAEGVAIAWIFNNYATNLVVEDVVVDCTNMDWGYGESCYAVVSREGDNVQLTGNTKFENFNSEVAGNAVISQGTMTIGENVIPGGTVELGAGATLTAREGLSVVTENGYFVKYADGTYTTVQAVAQIGETYYATFEEAVANIATDGSDTTIKLLTDIEIDQSIICEYGDGKIIFTADQPVTVKQTAVADLDFTKATNTVIVIGENVTFEIYDNASGIYLYYGPSMEISGTVTGGQNWGVLYLYDGEHTVTETGTLSVGRVQMGHTILTVLGTMDSNYLLVEGSEFVADGATVNVGAIHDSNNGAARWGASTMDFLNGTNVTANTVNLAYADSVITLDLSSKLTAGKLSGIGKIVIDAAAFDGTEVTVINADLSGFTGEIEVINNASATYKIGEDGTVTVVKVMVPPNANVSVLNPITLTKDDHNYMVWPSGDATIDRPLEIVMNFKAEDTLEDCLNGGYSEWLTDFNITFTGLENGSITADNCYLAGNYGTFGWIVIPTDGLVLEDGVTYPVVAAYDASLNYEDICNSVKDFTAAIHIDQAILDANPNLQVKLELVMTNPENAEDKLYVGEPAVYTAEELKNGCVAKNTETGKMYTDLTEALRDAEDTTVVLLGDVTVRSLAINFGTTLDLNGHTLNATRISTDADSHIIDSTNGKGLLNVTGTFTLNSRNAAIPVKTTEGYRFTGLDFVTQYKNDADSKVFRTYFVGEVGEDAASMLATELANGGADNGLTVRVKLTYTNLAGTTEEEKTFSFTDALVQEYAADWLKSDFRVTIKGAEKVANLQAAVEIVSTVGDQTVVVSSEPIDLTK